MWRGRASLRTIAHVNDSLTGFAGTGASVRVHVAGAGVLLIDAARGLIRDIAHVARDANAELGGAGGVVDEADAAVNVAHGVDLRARSVLNEREREGGGEGVDSVGGGDGGGGLRRRAAQEEAGEDTT